MAGSEPRAGWVRVLGVMLAEAALVMVALVLWAGSGGKAPPRFYLGAFGRRGRMRPYGGLAWRLPGGFAAGAGRRGGWAGWRPRR